MLFREAVANLLKPKPEPGTGDNRRALVEEGVDITIIVKIKLGYSHGRKNIVELGIAEDPETGPFYVAFVDGELVKAGRFLSPHGRMLYSVPDHGIIKLMAAMSHARAKFAGVVPASTKADREFLEAVGIQPFVKGG